MEKEFIPYKQALQLKELGFDEECIYAYYHTNDLDNFKPNDYVLCGDRSNSMLDKDGRISAPLYQQAFRWFREKNDYEHRICKLIEEDGYMASIGWAGVEDICEQVEGKTYEDAELECLKKLIELTKKRNNE